MKLYLKHFTKSNFFLLVPYLAIIFIYNYVPSNDEIYQLEGALRLYNGNGYTASNVTPTIYNINKFSYLHSWPIGYSVLIFSLMKFGLGLVFSAKLLKFFAIIFTYAYWMKFANKILIAKIDLFLFSILLILYSIVSASSLTDTILLLILAIICNLLHNYYTNTQKNSTILSIVLGFLCSISFLMKYTAIGIIVPTFLIYSYTLLFIKKENILKCLFFIIITLGTIIIVIYTNYYYTNEFNTITKKITPTIFSNIYSISYYEIIKTALIESTVLPLLISKSLVNFNIYKFTASSILIFLYLLFFIFQLFLKYEKRYNFLYIVTFLFILFNVLFLYFVSIVFYKNMNGWLPVYEVRYFTFCGILLLLVYLIVYNNFLFKIVISIVTIIFIFGFTYNKFISWKNITHEDKNIEKVISYLKKINHEKKFEIYTDDYLQNKIIRNGFDNYYTCNNLNIDSNSNINTNLKVVLLSQYDLSSIQIHILQHDSIENILRTNKYNFIKISNYTKLFYK